jgi:hypothetical protein
MVGEPFNGMIEHAYVCDVAVDGQAILSRAPPSPPV